MPIRSQRPLAEGYRRGEDPVDVYDDELDSEEEWDSNWDADTVTEGHITGPNYRDDGLSVELKYTDSRVWTMTSGAELDQVYVGNGPSLCDFTNTRGQALAFREWATFYRKYVCFGSKIRVTPFLTGPQITWEKGCITLAVGATKAFTVPVAMTMSNWISCPGVIFSNKFVINQSDRLECEATTMQKYGISEDAVEMELDFGCATTHTLPSNRWYWLVKMEPSFGADAGTTTVQMLVEIIYDVKFFDPKIVPEPTP